MSTPVAVANEAAPQMVQFALLLALVRSPRDLWLVFALQAIPPLSFTACTVYVMSRACRSVKVEPSVTMYWRVSTLVLSTVG